MEKSMKKKEATFFDVVYENLKDNTETRHAYAKYDDAVAFAKKTYIESLASSGIRIEESEPTEVDESKGLYYVEDKFYIGIEERILTMPHMHQHNLTSGS